jgi:hypothetical protein
MRRWHEYTPWAALALMVVFIGFLFYNDARSYEDRAALREAMTMQRRMLDARAEIQVILVRRAVEHRPLKAEEISRIARLCKQAEYDLIPNGCEGLK